MHTLTTPGLQVKSSFRCICELHPAGKKTLQLLSMVSTSLLVSESSSLSVPSFINDTSCLSFCENSSPFKSLLGDSALESESEVMSCSRIPPSWLANASCLPSLQNAFGRWLIHGDMQFSNCFLIIHSSGAKTSALQCTWSGAFSMHTRFLSMKRLISLINLDSRGHFFL